MMSKVYIVNGSQAYQMLFISMGYELAWELSQADLVCFTGGEDVSPHLYGAKKHPYTHSSIHRDEQEKLVYEECVRHNIPMVGICRGGQFLNVMNGGEMYQHVEGHTRDHLITDVLSLQTLLVSSTHHQMMKPSKKALIVATSHLYRSREWYEGDEPRDDISDLDIEVVWYEKTRSLCFQPHPEFDGVQYRNMRSYFNTLLKRFKLGV